MDFYFIQWQFLIEVVDLQYCVSGIQQSDSVYIYVYKLFSIHKMLMNFN